MLKFFYHNEDELDLSIQSGEVQQEIYNYIVGLDYSIERLTEDEILEHFDIDFDDFDISYEDIKKGNGSVAKKMREIIILVLNRYKQNQDDIKFTEFKIHGSISVPAGEKIDEDVLSKFIQLIESQGWKFRGDFNGKQE